jgi:hypothetical protein
MLRLFRIKRDLTGNLPGLPDAYPDTMAPIDRTARDGEPELTIIAGASATAPSRQGPGYECAQSEVAALARLA